MKKTILILTALLLTACISPPQGLEKDQSTIQRMAEIQPEDYACRCKNVRLGGKVLSVKALKNQTKLEILSLPILTFSARPDIDGQSDGRFFVYLDGFVDPETVKEQYVTISGTLRGKEKAHIDLADYEYPVIIAKQHKKWKLVEEYYYDPDDWADYWEARRFGWGYPFRPTPKLRYNLY